MKQASIFPEKARIFSGSGLKTLALLSMLIDHSAFVFYPLLGKVLFTAGGKQITVYFLMRAVGRLAFPIYVFLLSEGFRHTRDRRRYAQNLLLFALLSEIPFNLIHRGTWLYEGQNVFFTLFLGFLGIWVLDAYRENIKKQFSLLLPLLFAAIYLKADYGWLGFGFILAVYLLREQPAAQAIVGSCFLSSQVWAGIAFVPINLYNGKRGYIRGPVWKYLFYAIYPLHLLLLWYVRSRTIGW